jgi:hypothetical protein
MLASASLLQITLEASPRVGTVEQELIEQTAGLSTKFHRKRF